MKSISTLLLCCGFYICNYAQSTCFDVCPVPGPNWPAVQCEHYETLSSGDPLLTNDWKVFPSNSSSGYYPVPATIQLGHVGPTWRLYADFTDPNVNVDNNYFLRIDPKDFRFSYDLYLFQGKTGRFSFLDINYNSVITFDFRGSGSADILNANDVKIASFSYPQNTWFNMNLFYHVNSKSLEVFRNDYKISNITNLPNAKSTFPSVANFFSNRSGDAFLLGGVCLIARNTFDVICVSNVDPVCLNGTNEEVGSNSCWARVAGYLQSEFHSCTVTNNPCDDCDECFSYRYDCVDSRVLYLISSYCETTTPVFSFTGSALTDEFEWEFKDESNTIIQPEYLNGTSSTTKSPTCRLPVSGTYYVCFRVYKYNGSGRYKYYECCNFVKIGKPCSKVPTVYITDSSPNANSEVTLTPTTTDAETFSWRVDDATAYLANVSVTGSTFKCKIPTGKECITICLTVGNGCGMINKCLKVCRPNSNCGTKPTHPPITYQLNQNAEVSFTNVPLMDSYEWTLPGGCTFSGGTSSNSQSPICKLPDPNCFYLICLKMSKGSCYQYCYCFTIRPISGGTITFDPDEMSCVPSGQEVLVPVRIKAFTNVTSIDLTTTISPTTVADFTGAVAGPNVDASSFLYTISSTSRMRILWAGSSGSGSSLNDNDIFCYLKLKMKGAANTSATISFDASNYIVKENRVTVTTLLKTGSVCVNGSYTVCGNILREDNAGIKDVNVALTGASSQQVKTDASGYYCFTNVPAGSYTLKPTKNSNYGNGVEIDDISDIKGHLLGTFTLPSPYKIIAADADNNRQITATDLARIIPVVLDKSKAFAAVGSWRFIPKTYSFPNASNPFQSTFPESSSIQVSKNETNQDFTGIKIGDVTLDNNPQNSSGGDHEQKQGVHLTSRAAPSIDIKMDSFRVAPGQNVKVPITVKGFKKITAFGFSLSWQDTKIKFSQLVGFNPKLNLSTGNFNIKDVDKGKLGVTWFILNTDGITLADNEVLFSIEFLATGKDKEVSPVSFTESPTPISFADDQSGFEVNLKNGKVTIDQTIIATNGFENKRSYSMWPNPVSKELFLTFENSISDHPDFELYAAEGKALPIKFEIQNPSFVKFHTETLPNGFYYLKVRSSKGSFTVPFTKM